LGLAVLAIAAAWSSQVLAADDWLNLATVSMTNATTAKLTSCYVCYTDGVDIACNSPSLYVSTGGLVGIGTAGPDEKLHVVGGSIKLSSGHALQFADDDVTATAYIFGSTASDSLNLRTNSTDRLVINTSGNVGIGTTAPSTTLHVNSSSGIRLSHPSAPGGYYTDLVEQYDSTDPFYIYNAQVGRIVGAKIFSGLSGFGGGQAAYLSGYYGLGFATGATSPGTGNLKMVILQDGKVGVGVATPTTALEVSGTVSATDFVGNGSGLTGVTAASSDRIVSGTGNATRMVAVSNTGFISVTQSGADTAWFNPSTGFVTIGVSSTGGISGSTGYFYGKVGIGTATPGAKLDVGGALKLSVNDLVDGPSLQNNSDGLLLVGGATAGVRVNNQGNTLELLRITNAGNVGIGTASPLTGLHINNLGSSAISALSVTPTSGALFGDSTTNAVVNLGVNGGNAAFVQARDKSAGGSAFGLVLNPLGGNVGIGTVYPSSSVHVQSGGETEVGARTSSAADRAMFRAYNDGGGYFQYALNGSANAAGLFGLPGAGQANITAVNASNLAVGTFGANPFVLGTNNTERLRIDGTGKVGIGSATPTVALEVSGTISATNFIGNGSGLTGIVAASSDRIVSGTGDATSMVAISSTGYVSLTQSGVSTGWFNPQTGFVTIGVSSTGGISGTTGYFAGNVGIGQTTASYPLHVNGAAGIGNTFLMNGDGANRQALYAGSNLLQAGADFNTLALMAGNVGVKTLTPNATLHVSGSFIVSKTGQTTNPSLMVSATNGAVGIGGIPTYGANLEVYGTTYLGGGGALGGIMQLGGTQGSLDWRGMVNAIGNNTTAAAMRVVREGGAVATDLFQSYTDNATTPAFIIKGDGKVGIGGSIPTATLQVVGSMIVSVTGQTASPTLYVDSSGRVGVGIVPPSGYRFSSRGVGSTSATYAGYFSNSNDTTLMAIDDGGGVGIATSTPAAKLDVRGDISTSGVIDISGSSLACASSIAGALRWQSTSDTVQVCTASGWKSLVSNTSGLAATPGGVSGSIQFNSGGVLAGRSDIVISDTGKVGIGTETPSAPLTVEGSVNQLNVRGAGTTWGLLATVGGGGACSPGDTDYHCSTNGGNSVGLVNVNDEAFHLGTNNLPRVTLRENGNLGIGTRAPQATLQVSGSMIVSVTGQTTTPTLYVGTNGNIGIGTSAPGKSLEIAKSGGGYLRLRDAAGSSYWDVVSVFDTADSNLRFMQAGTTRFTIDGNNGNVGISTTSPIAKLDVVGTISASDAIQVSGSALVCASSINGAMRWNATSDTLQICTGNGWKSLVSGTAGGTLTGTGSATAVAFWNGASDLIYDSDGFYWDATNNRLGIGTNAPDLNLEASGGAIGLPATSGATQTGSMRVGASGTSMVLDFGVNNTGTITSWIQSTRRGVHATNYNLALNPNGGNVGVATATPTSVLQVSGTFTVSTSAQVTTPSVYVNTTGNVGIGTSSPIGILTVGGPGQGPSLNAAAGTLFDIRSTLNGTGYTRLAFTQDTASPFTASIQHRHATNDGQAFPLALNPLGGNVGIGTVTPTATLQVSGTFIVSNSAQITTPSLYVSNSGNVGIGTVNPGFPLDVQTLGGNSVARFYQGGASQNTDIYVNNVGSANNFLVTRRSGGESWLYNSGSDPMRFYTNAIPRVSILGTGNVGISNTTPIAKLDVDGTISTSSIIQISGTSQSCSSAIKGAMRYSNTSNTIEYCNSTAWTSMGPSGTDVPAFSVTKGSNQNVSGGASTLVTFDGELFDTNNNFASNRFTATIAGKYIITGQVDCGGGTNSTCHAMIYKDGAAIYYGSGQDGQAGSPMRANVTAIVDLAVGAYVELYGYTGGGTTFRGQAGTQLSYFSGSMIASGNGAAGGGGASPAGNTNDVQYNSGGSLAADTGVFTYASGVLKAPGVSSTYVTNTTSYFNTTNVTAALGVSGTFIASGTTRVSTSSAGTIQFVTGGTERMRVDASGNVLVGTATGAKFTVTGNDGTSGFRVTGSNSHYATMYSDAAGNIYFQSDTTHCVLGSSSTSWSCPSDARLKENVEELQAASGLAAISKLRPVTFSMIEDGAHAPQIGFIAQEVQKVFPELVRMSSATTKLTPDGTVVFNQTGLIPPLVKSVQELKADNDNLRADLKAANDNYQDLRTRLDALERSQDNPRKSIAK
jgi:hypothetical protein